MTADVADLAVWRERVWELRRKSQEANELEELLAGDAARQDWQEAVQQEHVEQQPAALRLVNEEDE